MVTIMKNGRIIPLTAALAAVLALVARADAPRIYAITGARIVTSAGAPIENGSVVLRNGFVEAAGASLTVPDDASIIDGKGLTVYPGLIDMGNSAGLEVPSPAQPSSARTREEVERWKREVILRPQVVAADHVKADAPDLRRLAAAGITSILAVPLGTVVKGQSSLLKVAAPDEEPQYGNIADQRRGLYVLRTRVALHVAFPERTPGDAYPESLMGVISFVRQAFLDAAHYQAELAFDDRVTREVARPVYDRALEAMQPALAGRMPVVFEADEFREILRALGIAKEFKLDPVIAGGVESDQAIADLKAQKSRVLFSVNYPVRSRVLAPDADEPLRALRQRDNAPKVPAALARAGVLFAFESGGLKDPKDFVRNVAKAVKAGLPPDVAVRAMTLDAATIAGVGDRLGSIEKGKVANLIVTDGDLFDEKMTIKHVFVDGRPVVLEPSSPPPPQRRGRPGGF
jgi:imidazolonepropionase-like amidohydrolase